MGKLNLSCTSLDKAISYVSKDIEKVKRLDLSYCNISSNRLKQLSDAIMTLNKPVCIILYYDYSIYSSICYKKDFKNQSVLITIVFWLQFLIIFKLLIKIHYTDKNVIHGFTSPTKWNKIKSFFLSVILFAFIAEFEIN